MTKRIVGGYMYQQEVKAGLGACRTVREMLERLLQERPGPALTALYVAQIATANLRIQEAFTQLKTLGLQETGDDDNASAGAGRGATHAPERQHTDPTGARQCRRTGRSGAHLPAGADGGRTIGRGPDGQP